MAKSSPANGVLSHEAYIWQRQWTAALATAVKQSTDLVKGWRVLAAESDKDGHLRPTQIDWGVLRDSGEPIVMVVRIDGQLRQWDQESLLADFGTILRQWQQNLPILTGVEIDHDCGTSQLTAYASFLGELRGRISSSMVLSVTALPTWLNSVNLEAVLSVTDQIVLQIHAVQDPRAGLFDSRLALRWIRALAARDQKPFQVALPAYGLRVHWREDGTVLAVEGEAPQFLGASNAVELFVPPADVAEFLNRLELDLPSNLRGVVWFRLPTDDDDRAWSLATWRAVVTGQTLNGSVTLMAEDSTFKGIRALFLINRGNSDVSLPKMVALPESCAAADGINGYSLEYRPSGRVLGRLRNGMLKAGDEQEIGWVRCASSVGEFHVEP